MSDFDPNDIVLYNPPGCSCCSWPEFWAEAGLAIQSRYAQGFINGRDVSTLPVTESHEFEGYYQSIELKRYWQLFDEHGDPVGTECIETTTYDYEGPLVVFDSDEIEELVENDDACVAPEGGSRSFVKSELSASGPVSVSALRSLTLSEMFAADWGEYETPPSGLAGSTIVVMPATAIAQQVRGKGVAVMEVGAHVSNLKYEGGPSRPRMKIPMEIVMINEGDDPEDALTETRYRIVEWEENTGIFHDTSDWLALGATEGELRFFQLGYSYRQNFSRAFYLGTSS